MSDGELAVIGIGSVGSMALWHASQLSTSVVGFDASSPAHQRSAVGGETRLFRMTYRGENNYYPILQMAERLWHRLEEESGQEILNQCGGLSIGDIDGPYIPALLESIKRTGAPYEIVDHAEMSRRYPQHQLSRGECGILDARAGFLRTGRAVLAAVDMAENHGVSVVKDARVREIRETDDAVVISTDSDSWKFDRVIVAAGGGSRALLPEPVRSRVQPHRIFLTWFTARDPRQFTPEAFPIFIRISGERSLYGTPTIDGVTVKATLDGRSTPTEDPDTMERALSELEVAESAETVAHFLPGLIPEVVRSDSYPDLFTADHAALLGHAPGSSRIYLATGFSGTGFKMSPAFGAIAAAEALGREAPVAGLHFLRPRRFACHPGGAQPTLR